MKGQVWRGDRYWKVWARQGVGKWMVLTGKIYLSKSLWYLIFRPTEGGATNSNMRTLRRLRHSWSPHFLKRQMLEIQSNKKLTYFAALCSRSFYNSSVAVTALSFGFWAPTQPLVTRIMLIVVSCALVKASPQLATDCQASETFSVWSCAGASSVFSATVLLTIKIFFKEFSWPPQGSKDCQNPKKARSHFGFTVPEHLCHQ